MWLFSTFGYQIGNFATTISFLALINAIYGAEAAALVSSIELVTGVAGVALLRMPMMMEHSANQDRLLRILRDSRIFVFLVGVTAILFFVNSRVERATYLVSLVAVCVTPAYELLRTSYQKYACWVVATRILAMVCAWKIHLGQYAVMVYFMPLAVSGGAVWASARVECQSACGVQSGVREFDNHGLALLFSVLTSALIAFSSQRLIFIVSSMDGYWVTLERVLRAGVSFSFPYLYRLGRGRNLLVMVSLLILSASLLFMALYGAGQLGSNAIAVMALMPAAISFSATWAVAERPTSVASMGSLIMICALGYLLW